MKKILDVSLDFFSQKGFSAVSIGDIYKNVGIKESSVYYHFKNKQSVFNETLQHFTAIATDLMSQLEQGLKVLPDASGENLDTPSVRNL